MHRVNVLVTEYANGSLVKIKRSWGGEHTKIVETGEIKEYIGFLRQLYDAAGIHIEVNYAVS